MDSGSIGLRRDGAIARIILDNRPRLNAISIAMWDELDRLLDAIAEDRTIRVVVIAGSGGKAFSAGADISEFDRRHADAAAVREASARDTRVCAKLEPSRSRRLPRSRVTAWAAPLPWRCAATCASAPRRHSSGYRRPNWVTAMTRSALSG